MNKPRREKAEALIKELGAILVELAFLKDEEESDMDSIISVLEVEALGEAGDAIEDALAALREAIS